jgi:hypothetical protein
MHAQRGLGSAALKRVQTVLKGFDDLDKDGRRKAIMEIADLGTALEDHLKEMTIKDPKDNTGFYALDALHYAMGRDIIMREVSVQASPYSRWTFSTGEILLLKGIDSWMGIRIEEKYDPDGGTMSVEMVPTKDRLQPMGGITEGRKTVELKGEDAPAKPGRATAFKARVYRFSAFGGDVEFLSVGTKGFRYRLTGGSPPVYLTGKSRFKDVRASLADDKYEDRNDASWDAHARRAQQYLFRIVPGHEPLPTYGTEDEAHFAAAESIHSEVRVDATHRPVVIVSFPHSEKLPLFDTKTHTLLLTFCRQCFGSTPVDLLVWAGTQELREFNDVFDGKAFAKPNTGMRARLRMLFPEDY